MSNKEKKETMTLEEETVFVKTTIEKIRKLESRQGKSRIELIRCHCGIGSSLIELQKGIVHGNWENTVVEELGYNKTTAQHLLKLAGSWLPDQIRTVAKDFPELAKRLPTDLQKLRKIIELKPEQFVDALRQHDFTQMNRTDVRQAVAAILKPGSDNGGGNGSGPSGYVRRLTRFSKAIETDLQAKVLKDIEDGVIDEEGVTEIVQALDETINVLEHLRGRAEESLAWEKAAPKQAVQDEHEQAAYQDLVRQEPVPA